MLEDEVTIKLIGKITLEYPNIDQLKLRDIIGMVLNNYNITSKETSLIASDIEEKIYLYIAVKRLDNLSESTLYNYQLQLINFASFLHKPINSIVTIINIVLKNSTMITEVLYERFLLYKLFKYRSLAIST